jgi:hypothetical protein
VEVRALMLLLWILINSFSCLLVLTLLVFLKLHLQDSLLEILILLISLPLSVFYQYMVDYNSIVFMSIFLICSFIEISAFKLQGNQEITSYLLKPIDFLKEKVF